jgi:hypothetical protein
MIVDSFVVHIKRSALLASDFLSYTNLFSYIYHQTYPAIKVFRSLGMSSQSAIAVTEVGRPVTKITLPKPEESELADYELLLKVSVAGCKYIIPSAPLWVSFSKDPPSSPPRCKDAGQKPIWLASPNRPRR